MNRLLFALLVALLIIGCSGSHDEQSAYFSDVNPSGWIYGDTISAFLPTDSCAESGYVALVVRHAPEYQYANIWLEVSQLLSADSVVRDTVNVSLADRYGRRLGRGNATGYVVVDTLPRLYQLQEENTFAIRHIMRVDTLPGVEQIGLILVTNSHD